MATNPSNGDRSSGISRLEKENVDLRAQNQTYAAVKKGLEKELAQLKRQVQDSNVVGSAAFKSSFRGNTHIQDVPDATPRFFTTVTVHPTAEEISGVSDECTNRRNKQLGMELTNVTTVKNRLQETVVKLTRKSFEFQIEAKDLEIARLKRIPSESSPAAQVIKKDLEIAQLTSKVTQLSRENQDLQGQLDRAQRSSEAEQQKFHLISREVAVSVRDLQKRLGDLEVESVRLRGENQTLRADLSAKEENLASAEQTVTNLRREVDDRDKNITDLFNTLGNLRHQQALLMPSYLHRSTSDTSVRREESPTRPMWFEFPGATGRPGFHSHSGRFNRYCSVCRATAMLNQKATEPQTTTSTSQRRPRESSSRTHVDPGLPTQSTSAPLPRPQVSNVGGERESQELRSRLRISQAETDQLRANLQSLESQLLRAEQSHRRDVAAKEGEIRRLRVELNNVPTSTRVFERSVAPASVSPANEELLKRAERAEAEQLRAEQKVEQLNQAVRQMTLDNERLSGDLKRREDLLLRAERGIAEKEVERANLAGQLQSKSDECHRLQLALAHIQNDQVAIKRRVDELQANLVRQESQVGQMSSELTAEKRENSRLQEDNRNFLARLESHEKHLEELKAQLVEAHSLAAKLRSRLDESVAKNAALLKMLEEKQREVDDVAASHQQSLAQDQSFQLLNLQQSHEAELTDLRAQLHSAGLQLAAAKNSITSLEADKRRLLGDTDELADQVKRCGKSLAVLTTQLGESQLVGNVAAQDLAAVRDKLSSVELQKVQLEGERIKLESQLQKAQGDLSDLRAEGDIFRLNQAESHVRETQLATEVGEINRRLQTSLEAIEVKHREVEELSARLDESNRALERTRRDFEQHKQGCDALKKQTATSSRPAYD